MDLARFRPRGVPVWPRASAPTFDRAMAVLEVFGFECHAARRAVPASGDVSPAMGIERRRAVGADDPQILEAMVVPDPIYVIEDQRHPPALPVLVLSTQLADAGLQALSIKTILEISPAVARAFHHHLFKRNLPSPAAPAEVIGGNAPQSRVLLERSEVVPDGAVSQRAKRVGPRPGPPDCGSRILFRERRLHERMFVYEPDRKRLGSPDLNRDSGLQRPEAYH